MALAVSKSKKIQWAVMVQHKQVEFCHPRVLPTKIRFENKAANKV
jgi:hypothetical protein